MLHFLEDLHDCVGNHDGDLHRKRCLQSSKALQASPRLAHASASLQTRSGIVAHLQTSTLHAPAQGFAAPRYLAAGWHLQRRILTGRQSPCFDTQQSVSIGIQATAV
jgi:hypothetical protein